MTSSTKHLPPAEVSDAAYELDRTAVTAATGEQYLRENQVGALFAREVVQPAATLNYAQSLGLFHGLEASTPFRLLDLPFELRQRVYHFALPHSLCKASTMSEDPFPDKNLTYPRLFSAWRSSKNNLALFRVNRQVSEEAIDYFYASNTFDVWLPFIYEGQTEIWLLPPVQNSSKGFPRPVSGRWYGRISLSTWRKMRRVCVVFGGSGYVRPGTPRYEWLIISSKGTEVVTTIPDELDQDAVPAEHEDCDCVSATPDDRAANFGLLCDGLEVSPTREKPLLHFETIFHMSLKDCDKQADVANCEKVQEIICGRLGIQTGGQLTSTTARQTTSFGPLMSEMGGTGVA